GLPGGGRAGRRLRDGCLPGGGRSCGRLSCAGRPGIGGQEAVGLTGVGMGRRTGLTSGEEEKEEREDEGAGAGNRRRAASSESTAHGPRLSAATCSARRAG